MNLENLNRKLIDDGKVDCKDFPIVSEYIEIESSEKIQKSSVEIELAYYRQVRQDLNLKLNQINKIIEKLQLCSTELGARIKENPIEWEVCPDGSVRKLINE